MNENKQQEKESIVKEGLMYTIICIGSVLILILWELGAGLTICGGIFVLTFVLVRLIYDAAIEKLSKDAQSIRDKINMVENKLRITEFQSERKQILNEFYSLIEQADAVLIKLKKYEHNKSALNTINSLESYIPLAKININMLFPQTSVSESEEIEKLATLRSEGKISADEFKAFSERFAVTTGEKAKGVVSAISDLHDQYKKGAMSEGNYHAALWTLMDKLDRKT